MYLIPQSKVNPGYIGAHVNSAAVLTSFVLYSQRRE